MNLDLDRLLEIRLETKRLNELELALYEARCELRRDNLRRGVSSPLPPKPRFRTLPRLPAVVAEDPPQVYAQSWVRKAQAAARPGRLIRPAIGQVLRVR